MANPSLFYNPKPQFFTSTGDMASGYKLFFYTPGTTTKKDTYTTSALSVANSNPITLNSRGEVTGDVYFDGAYKVVFTTSTDSDPPVASIWTVDNVTSLQQLYTTSSKSTDYTVVAADNNKVILVDATAGAVTITLLAAATAGDGFALTIKKIDSSANVVTIDGNASETIDAITTFPLKQQFDGLSIVCNASNWYSREAHTQTLLDKSGNESIILATTSSAVNELTITNAATGNGPSVVATGGDTNIPFTLSGKGTGKIVIGQATSTEVQFVADQSITDSSGNEFIKFTKAASAVNEITLANAATGVAPSITGSGEGTDLGLIIQPKEGSRTDSVSIPITLRATTTGTPAAGIGTGIKLQAESADESPSDFGQIEFCATDVTAGSEDTYFDILTRVAGAALTKVWRFIATGAFKGIMTHANTADRTYTFPDTDITQYIVQRVNTQTGAVATGTTVLPKDDTIPQNTEGDQVMSLSITPKSTSNILYIQVVIASIATSANGESTIAALFQDTTANALAVGMCGHASGVAAANQVWSTSFIHKMTAATISSTTFKVRVGCGVGGTTTFNGASAGRYFGGVAASSITITEVSP